jgi:hypothetical protein
MNGPNPSKRQLLRRLIAVFVAACLGVGIIWGFIAGRTEAAREAQREKPVKSALRISSENDEQVITLDADAQQFNGIQSVIVTPAPYQDRVRAYGTIVDLARLTDLSNGYQNAIASLQSARAKLAASRPAMQRAQTLNRDKAVSEAAVQAAQATFGADQAVEVSAESQVRTLSATAQQEWGSVLGKALIERSPVITRLIERQDVLLQITLPPGISVAMPPQTATIATVNGLQAQIKFLSAATRTDPKIQGISYFYIAAADSGVLPGMNVLAFMPTGKIVEGVTIPDTAIVWWQDRAWVYRRRAPDKFTRVSIATDLPAPGGGYITESLPIHAEIVTQGAQTLLSEEFRAQIQVLGEDKN